MVSAEVYVMVCVMVSAEVCVMVHVIITEYGAWGDVFLHSSRPFNHSYSLLPCSFQELHEVYVELYGYG